jgi:hypothetical protein
LYGFPEPKKTDAKTQQENSPQKDLCLTFGRCERKPQKASSSYQKCRNNQKDYCTPNSLFHDEV